MVDDAVVSGGVSGAFEEFFATRFAELSRLAFLLTGSSAVSDEIAQDACEEVFRRWNEVDHPRAYARRAVISGARSWGRRKARRASFAFADTEAAVDLDADALAVRGVLADLPTAEREVLVLRFFADLRVDDIASELDIPAGTVKSHIHRGLARMKKELS